MGKQKENEMEIKEQMETDKRQTVDGDRGLNVISPIVGLVVNVAEMVHVAE